LVTLVPLANENTPSEFCRISIPGPPPLNVVVPLNT
jgi:hypothetical protein